MNDKRKKESGRGWLSISICHKVGGYLTIQKQNTKKILDNKRLNFSTSKYYSLKTYIGYFLNFPKLCCYFWGVIYNTAHKLATSLKYQHYSKIQPTIYIIFRSVSLKSTHDSWIKSNVTIVLLNKHTCELNELVSK